jgi:iron complex outermembrane receptor protein
VRLTFGDTRIVAGVFEVRRPYFATDEANVYRRLGERRNRGIELSVVTQPVTGLRAVAGLIYYDPQVIGPAVALGQTGPRPLNSMAVNARLDLDYAIPLIDGLSIQLAAIHTGDVIASTRTYAELGGKQLRVPAVTTLDISARYRFAISEVPMAARVNLQNVTGEHLLQVAGSNSFFLRDARRISFQLSADF